MIVFGAGASYDSVTLPSWEKWAGHSRYRPPLADQLFEEREGVMTRFLQDRDVLGSIANEVRASEGQRDVEEVLADLVGRPLDVPLARQLLHVRYYLKSVIEACTGSWAQRFGWATHHATLMDLIARAGEEPVLLVTFNYDLMIEWGLKHLGYTFSEMADYTSHPMKLIKLHGSVDWGHVAGARQDGAVPAEEELLRDPLATIRNMTGEIVRGNEVDMSGRLLLPALAVPVREKDHFECPPEHAQVLTASLPSVKRLLVIGWRGGDKKLLSLIAVHASNLREICIVSHTPEAAAVTAQHLRAAGINGGFAYHADGFTGLMRLAGLTGRLPGQDAFSLLD